KFIAPVHSPTAPSSNKHRPREFGFCGLLGLLGTTAFVGFLDWSLLSMLIVSVSLGIVGEVIVAFSWSLASRKGFHYDYPRRESSWLEAGDKRLYTFEDWKAATAHRNR